MYDIEDDSHQEDSENKEQEEITIEETADQFTQRKDEEKLKQWRSE